MDTPNINEDIKKAMAWLARREDTVFIGQNIAYPESKMYQDLIDIPDDKKIEMPVAEDLQMGIANGLALGGLVPICSFPRFDFLILATNQIVNHLDKFKYLYRENPPRVIIRTAVGTTKPLDAGPQHTQDHTQAFSELCENIDVYKLTNPWQIELTYEDAYLSKNSSLIVEDFRAYTE